MSTTIKEKSSKKEDKKQTWSKSYERNGVREEISVEQVENGFVISKRKWGEDLNSSSSNKWIDKNEQYISSINPLEGEDINEDFEELIKKFR